MISVQQNDVRKQAFRIVLLGQCLILFLLIVGYFFSLREIGLYEGEIFVSI
jgi:hypothetical protein